MKNRKLVNRMLELAGVNPLVEDQKMVELTDSPTRDEVSNAWSEGVTYHGKPIFDAYVDKWISACSDVLRIGEEYDYEDFDEDGDSFTETARIEGQESYLGYDPQSDVFIAGWDMDEGDGILVMEITEDLEVKNVEEDEVGPTGMGGNFYPNGLKAVHKKYPHIIDVRLD